VLALKRIMWREILRCYRQGCPPRKERGRNSGRRPRPAAQKSGQHGKEPQSPDDFAHRPGFAKPTIAAGRERGFTH
jgi:hypothetical protein